jgi:hypothetical protein
VVTDREMKALLILIVTSLGAAALGIYANPEFATGVATVVSNEPTAILLSGSLLLGLAGALRRFPE